MGLSNIWSITFLSVLQSETSLSCGGRGLGKVCQEELVQIENVLRQVRLSQQEVEFQCSVAEMEDEDGRMGKLLQLLTDYSNLE